MPSGPRKKFVGSFLGATADVTIGYVPFKPGIIKFWNTTPRWGVKIQGQVNMDGANYLSSVGADVGVTINSDGFLVANGADVNQNGVRTYFECEEGTSEQDL